MAPVKAVLFDYGIVLSGPPNPAVWTRMTRLSGLTEDQLHQGYWAHRHAYDRGDLNGQSFWAATAQHAGTLLTSGQLASLLAADIDLWGGLNQPMVDWVHRLHQANIPTGILSNMGDAMETGLRARHPWIDRFNHHTWSHLLHLAKPEPAIYLHAAEGMRTPPENILFIDDKAENLPPALEAGMQVIHYTDFPAFEREMHTRGLAPLLQLEG